MINTAFLEGGGGRGVRPLDSHDSDLFLRLREVNLNVSEAPWNICQNM